MRGRGYLAAIEVYVFCLLAFVVRHWLTPAALRVARGPRFLLLRELSQHRRYPRRRVSKLRRSIIARGQI